MKKIIEFLKQKLLLFPLELVSFILATLVTLIFLIPSNNIPVLEALTLALFILPAVILILFRMPEIKMDDPYASFFAIAFVTYFIVFYSIYLMLDKLKIKQQKIILAIAIICILLLGGFLVLLINK